MILYTLIKSDNIKKEFEEIKNVEKMELYLKNEMKLVNSE